MGDIPATVVIDGQYVVGNSYGVQAIPADYLFDEKGTLQKQFLGWGADSFAEVEAWANGK